MPFNHSLDFAGQKYDHIKETEKPSIASPMVTAEIVEKSGHQITDRFALLRVGSVITVV